MKLYFTDKQVPEMSSLEFSQRRVVRDGAFDLFCNDHPQARWQVRLGNGIAALIGFVSADIASHRFLIQLLVVTIVTSVALLFFQSFLTERLRPYFRRYIDGHHDKISQAA
jgi:hypothetical protein